jgi:hypothetical protein
MTDQQLKQAQEIKRIIAVIEGELEKCGKHLPTQGINVFLPNVGTLIEDVRQVFQKHLNEYNKKFKEL